MKKLSMSKFISMLVVSILLMSGFSSFVAAADTLTATISASPSPVAVGDTITVTMNVTASSPGSPSYSATGVYPSSLTINSTGDGAVTYVSGPTPATRDIGDGQTRSFTWTYTATHTGTISFKGYATDPKTGGNTVSNTATSNTVTIVECYKVNISVTYNNEYDIDIEDIPCLGDNYRYVSGTASTPSCGDLDYEDYDGNGVDQGYQTIGYTSTGCCAADTFTFNAQRWNSGTSSYDVHTVTVNVTCTPNCSNSFTVDYGDSLILEVDGTSDFSCLPRDDEDEYRFWALLDGPDCGSAVSINSGQDINYTPSGCCGTDTFTFRAREYDTDDHEWENNYRVVRANITINCPVINTPPTAVDDSNSTVDDTTCKDINVTVNDSDTDGDPLTVTSVTTPTTFGTASIINPTGGIVRFCPGGNCGTATFDYNISDGNGGTDKATVTFTVPCNTPPTAVDDSETTNEDTCVNVTVLDDDTDPEGDPLSLLSVSVAPDHGTASISGGKIWYCPADGFCGADDFNYTISDGNGGIDEANVTITVNCVNDPPVAADDSETTNEDTCVNVTVLDDDTDPEGDPLSLLSVSVAPDHGTASISGGKIWYCPNKDWCGHDDFNYTISDGNGGIDEANVTITVICDDADPPVAADDSETTNEDTCIDVNVTENDTDPDNDSLSVESFTQGLHGTVTDQGSGVLRYCPDPNWCGSDNYNYTVTDGTLTDIGKVVITVTCINDPPVANDDYYSTDQGTELTIPAPGVLANDTDPEGDPLEVYMHETDVTSPANGTLVINENGSFTYTPNDGFCGEDTFTYRAGDFDAVSERATVTIEVKCRKSNPLPESILYPGIDIERLNVPATGINVISDGKVVSQLQIAPGTQSIIVEVENRGFLTQIDVGVRLEGLPQGVTYSTPQLQKVKAHNIATYTVTLTVSPEVPEGTYQIRAVAYSRKGPRDRIDLSLVVQ